MPCAATGRRADLGPWHPLLQRPARLDGCCRAWPGGAPHPHVLHGCACILLSRRESALDVLPSKGISKWHACSKLQTQCFNKRPPLCDVIVHVAEAAGRCRVDSMCSAGGVRCERASAYLRAKGPAFSDVLQLQGAQSAIRPLASDSIASVSFHRGVRLNAVASHYSS